MPDQICYGRALYYPYISFSNLTWLKTAALFYEGLNRIVPPGYSNFNDIEIIKRINDQGEFVRNVNPTNDALNAGLRFSEFMDLELADETARNNYYARLKVQLPDATYDIHDLKISSALKVKAVQSGLASQKKNSDYYTFQPVPGAIYMSYLANEMAKHDYLPVVTDDPIFEPLIRSAQIGTKEDIVQGQIDTGLLLATLAIESVVPENIGDIPIKKILEFRKNHSDEQHLFYNKINELVKDLRTVDNPTALTDMLNARKKDIELGVKDLRRAMISMKLTAVGTILGLSIPAFASGLGPIIATAGIVSVGGTKLAGQGIDYYKGRGSNPYAYVLSLKHLKAKSFVEQCLGGKFF